MAKNLDLDTCGGCDGARQETPARLHNPPGQQSLGYRIGTHSKFKHSMLTALSNASHPALRSLGTRDDDDFTIACIDGVATVLDVLSFYQERYVNENYLRTSIERRSVLDMAQLIGYELSPGVASSTHLAFTLQDSPGTPASQSSPITIPLGTRVQSIPDQGETPQIFETSEAIEARPQWNAVAAQTSIPYAPEVGDVDLYIDGIGHNIETGNAILIVGQDRINNSGSERWDVRVVKQVQPDSENLRTRLVWDIGLGHTGPTIHPAETGVQLFVFRKRSNLFGHNAPDPRIMVKETSDTFNGLLTGSGSGIKWDNFEMQNNQIDLANAEEKIVTNSWIALVSNHEYFSTADLPGYIELYRAKKVTHLSRSDFSLSGKISRIEPDTTENLSQFTERLRETSVLAASEALPLASRPIHYPVFSDIIVLQNIVEGLLPNQFLSVSGLRQRIRIAPGVAGLVLQLGEEDISLNEMDSLILNGIPAKRIGLNVEPLSPSEFGVLIEDGDSNIELELSVTDNDGLSGTISGSVASDWQWDNNNPLNKITLPVSEIAQIQSGNDAVLQDRFRTSINLSGALNNIYQRSTVRISFNVAPATHGETVAEILGNGDARKTDQAFVLQHAPLTHISADTPSGGASTLEVRVNELLWQQTSSLYTSAPDERVFQLKNQHDGRAAIVFGDGIEGSRLPSGQTNVRAVYRKYVGTDANLAPGKLATLLQRPLGVTDVTNPEASSGGANPEIIEDARENAPLTVLTLDRAVSELDYQNYARAFSGVAKAHALWVHSGSSRGIYITLAGIDGESIPEDSPTYLNLVNSLRRYGDPMLPLTLVNYSAVSFALGLAVKVSSNAIRETVLETLDATLRDYFSFANRDFGKHVSQDEILAVAHSIESIDAVRITRFYKLELGAVESIQSIIASRVPVASLTTLPTPAELLTLSEQAIEMDSFS